MDNAPAGAGASTTVRPAAPVTAPVIRVETAARRARAFLASYLMTTYNDILQFR